MDPQEQLAARPSLQAAERDYIAFLSEARAAAEKVAPTVEWDTVKPERTSESLCGSPFDDVAGASSRSYATGGIGEIPDEDWQAAADAVGEVAQQYGYNDRATIVDRPGQHAEAYENADGARLTFESETHTSLLLFGACHVT